jgi:hypothetical protein
MCRDLGVPFDEVIFLLYISLVFHVTIVVQQKWIDWTVPKLT